MQHETPDEMVESPGKASLVGMLTSPGEQFRKIEQAPIFLKALIAVTILSMITAVFAVQGMQDMFVEDFVGLDEEEMVIFTIITKVVSVIVAAFAPAIVILIGAAIYFVIAKVVKSDVTFKQMFSMYVYITFVSTIGGLINALFINFANGNPEIPFTSLNILVQADGALGILLSSIELFTIWVIILTAIGLQIVAKFSKALAWGIVIVFTVISVSAGMIVVVASQSFGL